MTDDFGQELFDAEVREWGDYHGWYSEEWHAMANQPVYVNQEPTQKKEFDIQGDNHYRCCNCKKRTSCICDDYDEDATVVGQK